MPMNIPSSVSPPHIPPTSLPKAGVSDLVEVGEDVGAEVGEDVGAAVGEGVINSKILTWPTASPPTRLFVAPTAITFPFPLRLTAEPESSPKISPIISAPF
mmetsp:Transcript_23936/g.74890  ORF Transcript_23936/g.74890 Transcript_23936/m.74890 type:complete len:101 (-) Transcript_23936:38-340(-)